MNQTLSSTRESRKVASDEASNLPGLSGPVLSTDTEKIKQMIEVTERRFSAFAVVPGKGTMLMEKSNQGNFELVINTSHGSRLDFTIDKSGKVLKVGSADIRDLPPVKQLDLDQLNEYLTALPPEQIQRHSVPDGRFPDLKPDVNDQLARMLQSGRIDKTEIIKEIWAAQGGKPSQLAAAVNEMKLLHPYALTPELFEDVRKELLNEAARVKTDPESSVRAVRAKVKEVFRLADPQSSEILTEIYQRRTGDRSVNIAVTSSSILTSGLAIQIGDGNIGFSKELYQTIKANCPNPADQEKIIVDIISHERAHYENGDAATMDKLIAAHANYAKKLQLQIENGIITKGDALARTTAADLLLIAAVRTQERLADGSDGLDPAFVRIVNIFYKEQQRANEEGTWTKFEPEPSVVAPRDRGLWQTHPPLTEREVK